MGVYLTAAALWNDGNRDLANKLRLASNPATREVVCFTPAERSKLSSYGINYSVPLTAGLLLASAEDWKETLTVWGARMALLGKGMTQLARRLANYAPDTLISSLSLGPGEMENIRRALAR